MYLAVQDEGKKHGLSNEMTLGFFGVEDYEDDTVIDAEVVQLNVDEDDAWKDEYQALDDEDDFGDFDDDRFDDVDESQTK